MQQGRVASIPTVASLMAAFFAISATGGVLGAGLAIPTVAAFGSVTKSTVGLYDELPSAFNAVVPNQQSAIYASDGKTVIATLYDENRIVVPLAQIAPIMRKAQVAIEDKRFYQHGGVDLEGMGAVAAGVAAGKNARGASTLTQQYVKVTLQTDARNRGDTAAEKAAAAPTPARKLQEMKFATELEKVKTKDEILQGYLNLVYFGDLAYGVEAAARHFFSTTAAKLTLTQAATLAGQVQNPGTVNAVVNPAATLKRRNVVLGAMHEQGVITDAEFEKAVKEPLGLKIKNSPDSCAASPYPFYCNYVVNWLKHQPAFGIDGKGREGTLRRGGYKIVTTLDATLQKDAQDALRQRVAPADFRPMPASKDGKPPTWDQIPNSFGGAAVTLDPNNGKVRSMVLSADYTNRPGLVGKQSVNWATDASAGASGGFAIGSTMKMFALAAALSDGWGVNDTINNIRTEPASYFPRDFPDGCGTAEEWVVQNSEGDDNPTSATLRVATAHSINTAFAALTQQLGPCKVRDVATKMGLHKAVDGKPIDPIVSDITLGSGRVSPMTVAQTYGVIGAKGRLCPAVPVESVTDPSGKKVALKIDPCRQVIPEQVANGVADLLKSVITEGTGRGLGLAGGRPAAGKTGTDDGNESWFAGVTPQLSTAVWVGTPLKDNDPARHRFPFKNVTVNGRFYSQVFGAELAGPVWKDIMNAASEGLPVVDFGQPSAGARAAAPAKDGTVPDVTGMSVDAAMSKLRDAGYAPYVSKYVSSGSVDPGLVISTRPSGGTAAEPGRSVGLRVSGKGAKTAMATRTAYKPSKPDAAVRAMALPPAEHSPRTAATKPAAKTAAPKPPARTVAPKPATPAATPAPKAAATPAPKAAATPAPKAAATPAPTTARTPTAKVVTRPTPAPTGQTENG